VLEKVRNKAMLKERLERSLSSMTGLSTINANISALIKKYKFISGNMNWVIVYHHFPLKSDYTILV
jgi:hypothetical protein